MRLFSHLPGRIVCLALVCLAVSGCNQDEATPEALESGGFDAAEIELPDDDQLRDEIDEVIGFTGGRYMSAKDHAAWQIVHGIVGYGRGLQIYDHQGELVSALDYLLAGGTLRGWNLFEGSHGVGTLLEAGSKTGQGHPDQWLGYLSLCGLPGDEPVIVQDQTFTIHDLVTQAQWEIFNNMEASWTLMGLSTYLPLDATWKSKDGSVWTIERIMQMEADQDLSESACGGSHRLCGLSVALNRYLAEGGEPTGGWLAAEQKIQDSIDRVRRFQQPDGSFSTSYFDRPGSSPDLATKMSTTGHTLEFLTYALTDEQLAEPWVKAAVAQLCKIFRQTRDLPMECGGLYHSARGLQNYRLRMYGAPTFAEELADTQTDEDAAIDAHNEAATSPGDSVAR